MRWTIDIAKVPSRMWMKPMNQMHNFWNREFTNFHRWQGDYSVGCVLVKAMPDNQSWKQCCGQEQYISSINSTRFGAFGFSTLCFLTTISPYHSEPIWLGRNLSNKLLLQVAVLLQTSGSFCLRRNMQTASRPFQSGKRSIWYLCTRPAPQITKFCHLTAEMFRRWWVRQLSAFGQLIFTIYSDECNLLFHNDNNRTTFVLL